MVYVYIGIGVLIVFAIYFGIKKIKKLASLENIDVLKMDKDGNLVPTGEKITIYGNGKDMKYQKENND